MNKLERKVLNLIPDKMYLKIKYRHKFGKKIDIKNPQTYNEKLQWLKLYDRNPLYTKLVDKYEVRKYIIEKVGEEYLIPLINVYDNVEEIDFDKLPDQFVLKCTHDSGGLVICKDKKSLDVEKVKKKLKTTMQKNYFYSGREWPYKNVKPRIVAEKYMEDEDGELKDYKFFCFNGKAKMMFIATDRFTPNEETKFDFFDMNFEHLPFVNGHPNSKEKIEKPIGFEEMQKLAEKLSEGIAQVRIDFYNINGKIYFGEMTFFHWGGMVPFEPEEWDYKIGEWIELPDKKKRKW